MTAVAVAVIYCYFSLTSLKIEKGASVQPKAYFAMLISSCLFPALERSFLFSEKPASQILFFPALLDIIFLNRPCALNITFL